MNLPSEAYSKARIMTAGRLRSVIMLLNRAEHLLAKLDHSKQEKTELIQVQNIIAQLEIALNFRKGSSAFELFDYLEEIYARLDFGSKGSLHAAQLQISRLRETLETYSG